MRSLQHIQGPEQHVINIAVQAFLRKCKILGTEQDDHSQSNEDDDDDPDDNSDSDDDEYDLDNEWEDQDASEEQNVVEIEAAMKDAAVGF